ncbi:protein of unknown function [Candidatus Promineifilum breve]|uniref:Uncharacterized protein n=1 Tax=Candidatus Promineifilum breve TaxID=1806508 RepID=A0A160T5S4_9CHLR|nr:hypothetical protein [Candidatus Promineifilum breve]CUS04235.2 protein of unknown function [Candidatus Promineifilum breve]
MSIALMQQRRELNKRKLAALAFLARAAELEGWPERLEGLAKQPAALANEGMMRSLVHEVVQVVATEGTLPKAAGSRATSDERRATSKEPAAARSQTDKEVAGETPAIQTGKA